MAGGTWTAQNKVRPGAYINFESVPAPTSNVGTRGIVTIPVEMSWGPENEMIPLYSTDLLDGSSLAKVGVTAFDMESLLFREALSSAYFAKVWRINIGGVRAEATVGQLRASARYAGKLGNKLTVAVQKNKKNETLFDVITYLSGSEQSRQTICADGAELVDNDFIDFDLPESASITANAGVSLTGGTNGTVQSDNYADYFAAAEQELWNTMAIPSTDELVKAAAAAFIKNRREATGKKCQAVLCSYASADHEGVISVEQGYINLAAEEVTPAIFTATVAGFTASAQVNQSNTGRLLSGAVRIITPLKEQDVEAALKAGKLVLTRRQDGGIAVEQDINTHHSFTPTKGYEFSKNRVIRVLDDIGNQILTRFENTFVGKADNNAVGRTTLRAVIVAYLQELSDIGAIQNLDAQKDVTITQGTAIDAVVADLWVQPVDAMEKLYLKVYVSATDAAHSGGRS